MAFDGSSLKYHVLNKAVGKVRESACYTSATLDGDWKEEFEVDYKKRHRRR